MKISPRIAALIVAVTLLSACSGAGGSTATGSPSELPPMQQSSPADQSFNSSTATQSVSTPSESASPAATSAPSDAPSASPSPSSSPAATTPPATSIANWAGFPVDAPWKENSTHGSWHAKHNGHGTTRVVADETISNALALDPDTSKGENQTHAALVTSTANFDDFDAAIDLQTIRQLRTGSAPNPWEVGSFLWHYTDDKHFYYFLPKTNGWELGKEDPSAPGGRRSLATGTSPAFPIGTLQKIRVVQNGDVITVYDNRLKIVSLTDTTAPYASGRFGLYCEDSQVHFGSLNLTTTAGTTTL